jgi:hypothetical protein
MKTDQIKKTLYNGKETIIFYPNSHRYRKEGDRSYLLSATAITGKLNKPFLLNWAANTACQYIESYVRNSTGKLLAEELYPIIEAAKTAHEKVKEKAATAGTIVHEFAEKFAKAKIDNQAYPEIKDDWSDEVKHGVEAFLDWYSNNNVKFIESERLVYSKKYKYAGLFDVLAEVNGKLTIIDYKTSNGIYDEHYLQLVGYYIAVKEEFSFLNKKVPEMLSIIRFGKEDGRCDVECIEDELMLKLYQRGFLGLLEIAKSLKELNKLKY